MEIIKVVPTLEALARDAVYRAIIDELSLCYRQGSTGKHSYHRSPQSEAIRSRVRRQLDQTLVGIVSDQARYNYKFLSFEVYFHR